MLRLSTRVTIKTCVTSIVVSSSTFHHGEVTSGVVVTHWWSILFPRIITSSLFPSTVFEASVTVSFGPDIFAVLPRAQFSPLAVSPWPGRWADTRIKVSVFRLAVSSITAGIAQTRGSRNKRSIHHHFA